MKMLVQTFIKMGMIVGLFCLTACAQQLGQLNKDLANINQSIAAGSANSSSNLPPAAGLAQKADTGKTSAMQLIVPPDRTAAAAFDAALPAIKKVIGLHECMKDVSGARLFSTLAIPGGENTIFSWLNQDHSPIIRTKFHDKNKCVGVRVIDQVALLALNALQIRVVYLAEDSGEASNFHIQLMKMGDGSWKLARITPLY
jgi:hypothetical protein